MARAKKKKKANDVAKRAHDAHKKYHGKISISLNAPVRTMDDLSLFYTPGVGAVAATIAKHPKKARDYTSVGNSIAVVSDGSAVLGLGNIGPLGALPVMEGKSLLFKKFADINAYPIVLGTQDTEEIIATVKAIAPSVGGINLEDIAAPRCFEIEARLRKELPIPVMHDDQHGTAIIVLAGLINAAKVVGKKPKQMRAVVVGAGAAGVAVAKLFLKYGVKDVIVTDSKGIVSTDRKDLSPYKKELAKITNHDKRRGSVHEAVEGADVLVGVSGPGSIKKEHVAKMAERAIVFALANPVPEIYPDDAKAAGAYVVATGRSDFPNQVNNSLAFPGVFRGALDNRVKDITDTMKVRAAENLAAIVKKPTRTKIIPSIFEKGVLKAVAKAIR